MEKRNNKREKKGKKKERRNKKETKTLILGRKEEIDNKNKII